MTSLHYMGYQAGKMEGDGVFFIQTGTLNRRKVDLESGYLDKQSIEPSVMEQVMSCKTGVLIVNLGSPESPSKQDVKQYLHEFLSDPRVMTMPTIVRWLLLRLVILPFRPALVSQKYQSIWQGDAFPLISHSLTLGHGLQEKLGSDFQVEVAMRYGRPSITGCLQNLEKAEIQDLVVVPLFPQYASATSGSILEKVLQIVSTWRLFPSLRLIRDFYSHPLFISAWGSISKSFKIKNYDHVLFSFHGLPESHITAADRTGKRCFASPDCCESVNASQAGCYRAQCIHTTKLLANQLDISREQFSISFQSRLGRGKWLEPATIHTVQQLAKRGKTRLLVFCPSFVADCLETTEEILGEVKSAFLEAGGEKLDLVPSLNSQAEWVNALEVIIREKSC